MVITRTIKQTTGVGSLTGAGLKLSVYPNPFSNVANIVYYIPEDEMISIGLYDDLGRRVQWLYEGEQNAGDYHLNISSAALSAGVYQLMFTAGDKTIMQKVVLMNRE